MPDIPPAIGAAASKGMTAIQHYVPPVLGISAGFLIGDIIGIGGYINGAIAKGQSGAPSGWSAADVRKLALLMTGAVYALIGVMIWKGVDGWLGKLVGGFFLGVALRALWAAMKGAM